MDCVEKKQEHNDCSAGFALPALASEGVLPDEFFLTRFIKRYSTK
jgi:hypothetical protein